MLWSSCAVLASSVTSTSPTAASFSNIELRTLDGVELFQIIGFHLPYLRGEIPQHELLSHMSGNAFSAFAIGAVLIGICAQLRSGES